MKLQLVLATALLTISATSAQADTRTPDILASVSGGGVQALSKADTKNTRGEWAGIYTNGKMFVTISDGPYTPYVSGDVATMRMVGKDIHPWLGYVVYVSH